MSEKAEILFLAHRIPYPPDKGDKIRSWRLFHHLTERYRVHLGCFIDDPRDNVHTEKLTAMCESAFFAPLNPKLAKLKSASGFLTGQSLSMRYYNDPSMREWVAKARENLFDAEIAFSSTMAQYMANPVGDRLRIVDFCDADSEKWFEYSQDASAPMDWVYNREGHKLASEETAIANWADTSFAVTAEEASIFNKRKDNTNPVGWWSNGVDTEYFSPTAKVALLDKPADVVFTGAMDYRANVEAVQYFCREVWPKVLAAKLDASFAIVGSNPASTVEALGGAKGVRVTGRVEDVRPWLKQASLVVAPLRVARGVQNKVLEGMAMAKPVIASKEAATGIVEGGKQVISICGNADEMAARTIELLTDQDAAKKLGENARQFVIDNFDWDARLKRFDEALPPVPSI